MSAGSPGKSSSVLAVTGGDPAGIGLDVTLAAYARRTDLALPAFAVLSDADAVVDRARMLGLATRIEKIGALREANGIFNHALPVVHTALPERVVAGRPSVANGAAIIAQIRDGTNAVLGGEADALVTNPIAKHVLTRAGFVHQGHTEYLAELAGATIGQPVVPVMMLAAPILRVVPMTIHVPLAAVPGLITVPLIERTIRITASALRRDFGIAHPRIVVAGLNPHAGEIGTIGTEETVIHAAIATFARDPSLTVRGPLAADSLFHAAARVSYDVVIAMYHDQALIPIKTLAFDTAVNVTLGLPFVRTSPDHGTAFEIAGTGAARPDSFIAALRLADELAQRRAMAA